MTLQNRHYALMRDRPETRFARGPNGYNAYQVTGQGPPDLLIVESWGNSIDLQWDSPLKERWLRRLESWGRVIRFDKRGEGASDTLESGYLPSGIESQWIEAVADDMEVVADEVASERAIVLGLGAGGCPAMVYAATRPDRVAGLLLVDPIVRIPALPGEPGISEKQQAQMAAAVHRYWGTGMSLALSAGSLFDDRELRRWMAQYERLSCPRGVMARTWEVMAFDLTPVLAHVQAPTLVFIHEGQYATPRAVADTVCAIIPQAEGPLVVSSGDTALWAPHPEWVYDEIQQFVSTIAGTTPAPRADRVFAVILFTDVVESTRRLSDVGDRRWKELLDVHDSVASREIERARGRLVTHSGDGVLATFDAPARAVACATAIGTQLRQVGVDVRAGLHAGEVQLRGDDIGGIAVHLAARVMGMAAAGEVLVSRTVKDLVAGSGLRFEDRGMHALKGIPDEWHIYAAEA